MEKSKKIVSSKESPCLNRHEKLFFFQKALKMLLIALDKFMLIAADSKVENRTL